MKTDPEIYLTRIEFKVKVTRPGEGQNAHTTEYCYTHSGSVRDMSDAWSKFHELKEHIDLSLLHGVDGKEPGLSRTTIAQVRKQVVGETSECETFRSREEMHRETIRESTQLGRLPKIDRSMPSFSPVRWKQVIRE